MISIDSQAPDFELLNQEGSRIRLSNYQGSIIVLYFYPKDNTPGCTTEACDFRDSMNDLKKFGILVLGVSPDSVESHRKFHDERHLNFDLLSDRKKDVIKLYGADGALFTKRMTYIIDKDQKVRYVFEKVNPKSHSRKVLNMIKELNLI
ncbi:MAG: peroxiredoxin [Nitrososphaeria archaeon]|nr:peroxiredoxin [Conexivisphaerales archaeon]